MATDTKQAGGAAVADPQPEQEQPNWVSLEQAEKFARMISRRYVRKGKPKESKEFYYKITGMHPVEFYSVKPDSAPTPDHYLPLLYVIALRRPDDKVDFPVEGIDGGSISMLAVRLG